MTHPKLPRPLASTTAALAMLAAACTTSTASRSTTGSSASAAPGDSTLPNLPGEPSSPPNAPPEVMPITPELRVTQRGPALARRLTNQEYQNVLSDVLGVDLGQEYNKLPEDLEYHGFKNIDLQPTGPLIDAYWALASAAVERLGDDTLLAGASCAEHSIECRRSFIESWGTRLFRRPPSEARLEKLAESFAKATSDGESFAFGGRIVLQAMLNSPEFLYRLEQQRADVSGAHAVDSYELASRLSFLIWGSAPDPALLAAAASGNLDLASQLARMLEDARATRAHAQYVQDWLELNHLQQITRNPALFPQFNRSLAQAMAGETERFFQKLVWQDHADYRSMLTANFTFATPELASLYEVPSQGEGYQLYDLSSQPTRVGLLTQPAILTITSVADEGAIIDRGVFMLRNILCRDMPEPPPNAAMAKPPATQGSERDRLAVHREDPSCGACHAQIDPLGYAFENYTAIGSFRTVDKYGFPLSGAGVLNLDGGTQPFADIREFVAHVAQSSEFQRCLVKKRLTHALGRPLSVPDQPTIDSISSAFARAGSTYQGLLRAIAQSEDLGVIEALH